MTISRQLINQSPMRSHIYINICGHITLRHKLLIRQRGQADGYCHHMGHKTRAASSSSSSLSLRVAGIPQARDRRVGIGFSQRVVTRCSCIHPTKMIICTIAKRAPGMKVERGSAGVMRVNASVEGHCRNLYFLSESVMFI